MRQLGDLTPLYSDEALSASFDVTQGNVFYELYLEDFVTTPLVINGKKIRIEPRLSRVSEYKIYQETFYHIITRKIFNDRHFDCNRANRIHWIKPILLSHPCKEIKYYWWRDEKGVCKEHFWYFEKEFMVVLVNVAPDKQIVTSFCVDKDERETFFERYSNYREGKSGCP
jgi:hypothetical protein